MSNNKKLLKYQYNEILDFSGGSDSKASAYNAGDLGLILGSGRSPGMEWQPTPVFLPGEYRGQRSLGDRRLGYSPWGHKELDTTEQLSLLSLHCSLKMAFLSPLAMHSVGYIFPFLPCLLLLFSQLFVRPPWTTTLPSCISFSLGWFWSLPPVQCCESLSIVLQALCLPDLIP